MFGKGCVSIIQWKGQKTQLQQEMLMSYSRACTEWKEANMDTLRCQKKVMKSPITTSFHLQDLVALDHMSQPLTLPDRL